MKDLMERLVVLPFSVGCSTQSSVAVAATHQRKEPNQLIKRRQDGDEDGFFHKEDTKMDNHGGTNISDGIYKIIRSFKSLSHFFIRYGERQAKEEEMEIGFPTDVKHLSHIGVDGTMATFPFSSPTSSSFPFSGFHLTAG